MAKHKFTAEFEINASKKMLYPYLCSASGLAQWFADDVNINEDKIFNFIWDGQDHKAKITTYKVNSFVKFEMLDHSNPDPNYFEFKLDMNELTQSVFLKITDYSDNDDDEELYELWSNLVEVLKEIVGG